MVGSNSISALPNLEANTSILELHAQNNPITQLSHVPPSIEYLNVEYTQVTEEEVAKLNIQYSFAGNPYTGIREHAIDGNSRSVFGELFIFFPLAHSALKRSGINIICDEGMRRSCFRNTFDENYAKQKQAFLHLYPEFLDQDKTWFVFYARIRRQIEFQQYFEQDPQLFGFFFPYEGGIDFFHKDGRVSTSDWEEGYHAFMKWIKEQS